MKIVHASRIIMPEEQPPRLSFTLTAEQTSGLKGNARMHALLHAGYNYRVYPD